MNGFPRKKAGFVLPFTLCLFACLALVVLATMDYAVNSLRLARGHLDRTTCRLAAQSALEQAKEAVHLQFKKSSFKGRNLVGVTTSTSGGDFAWFGESSAFSRTIGTINPLTLPDHVTIGDCRVYVRVARVKKPSNTRADVTLVAKAILPAADAKARRLCVSCLRETVCFSQNRSKVFDNAYFVNNYGWFQGTGCVANGDVRANGDIYLDSGCRVNGRVYAVRNEDLNVDGEIQNYGKMDNRSTYKGTTYGTSNRARPLDVSGGYAAPNSVSTTTYKERLYDQARMEELYPGQDDFRMTMPYISELQDYVEWATELHAQNANLGTIRQGGNTIATVKYDGPGPSGLTTVNAYDSSGRAIVDSEGRAVTTRPADYGALVLVGTQTNPIEINGPVIVPNDVIIKGYVTGQGTIYSGRNIHVVGSIKYVNPPSWANKAVSETANNASKDLVGFMAKGNIVMGDCTSSSWLSGIQTYLNSEPYVQKYACDSTDADIGYPSTFQGSYVAKEYVSGGGTAQPTADGGTTTDGTFAKLRTETVSLGTYHTETTTTYDWRTRRYITTTKQVEDTATVTKNSYNRRYYESVCLDKEISSRCETITQLDGVFYNNHGIFGKLGSCTVNGSLVCRNEGLQYSSYLYLNWDYRLYSGSAETVDNNRVGLAKSSGQPPVTLAWQEIPKAAFDTAAGAVWGEDE